jgi:Glycosyltransferase family 10 (fucosyltransferase) C-term
MKFKWLVAIASLTAAMLLLTAMLFSLRSSRHDRHRSDDASVEARRENMRNDIVHLLVWRAPNDDASRNDGNVLIESTKIRDGAPFQCVVSSSLSTSLSYATDGVLFDERSIQDEYSFPESRYAHQLWILKRSEPHLQMPYRTVFGDVFSLANVYNLTASFVQLVTAGSHAPIDIASAAVPDFAEHLERKVSVPVERRIDGAVLWAVDVRRCGSANGRERFIAALARHIDVHVIVEGAPAAGNRGLVECVPKSLLRRIVVLDTPMSDAQLAEYKFALAIGDVDCMHAPPPIYWRLLAAGVVPIVRTRFALAPLEPSVGAVINAGHMSALTLGQQLRALDTDDAALSKLLAWRLDDTWPLIERIDADFAERFVTRRYGGHLEGLCRLLEYSRMRFEQAPRTYRIYPRAEAVCDKPRHDVDEQSLPQRFRGELASIEHHRDYLRRHGVVQRTKK